MDLSLLCITLGEECSIQLFVLWTELMWKKSSSWTYPGTSIDLDTHMFLNTKSANAKLNRAGFSYVPGRSEFDTQQTTALMNNPG